MAFRDRFWGNYYRNLENMLDGLALQQKIITQNIANASNPNYHPMHVDFGDYFQKAYEHFKAFRSIGGNDESGKLDLIDEKPLEMHFDFSPEFHAQNSGSNEFKPTVTRDPVAKVDLNKEMAQLAKTQILYNMVAVEDTPSQSKWIIELFK